MTETKLCTRCKNTKALTEFGVKKNQKPNSWCKQCVRDNSSAHYKRNNPDAVAAKDRVLLLGLARDHPDYDRLYTLFRKHKLTPERLEAMLETQQNRCPICSVEFIGYSFAVDHDHSCCSGNWGCEKCVRGLLCITCNSGIGFLQDNVDIVRNAVTYLEKSRSTIDDANSSIIDRRPV